MEVVGKSTITGKYQLTLPKSVREFLRAYNRDLIVFIRDRDKILVKRGTVKVEDWAGRCFRLRTSEIS